MILLNDTAWDGLTTSQREALIDHELCHAAIVLDDDGQPKKDDRGRLVCRIKKHDMEEFRAVVERHGLWTADLEQIAQAAMNDANRPLLKDSEAEAETASPESKLLRESAESINDDTEVISDEGELVPGLADPDPWKKQPISALGLDSSVEEFILDAGHQTIGSLSKWMEDKGQWWVKDMVVGGKRKPPNFQTKVEEAFAEFWAD